MAATPRFPAFLEVARRRPVAIVCPSSTSVVLDSASDSSAAALPQPAPYAAIEVDLVAGADEPVVLRLRSADLVIEALHERDTTWVRLTHAGVSTEHRSRRSSRSTGAARLALTLTGTHVTALTAGGDDPRDATWTARARVDLARPPIAADTRDEAWLAGLLAEHDGPVARLRAGGFGQLGLRDLRLVTHEDGTPVPAEGGGVLLSASSAGPGFFDTAHTSLWRLATDSLELDHRADLFFRRPDRRGAFGDHATHVVLDRPTRRWLVATSTWGDFDRARPDARVEITLAEAPSWTPLTTGRHLLDTRALAVPAPTGSVGVWDPHLMRADTGWTVGFVSARRWFVFGPGVAEGPDLDRLRLRAADTRRRATEGTTIHRDARGGRWVLVSDGPQSRRGRRRYAVLDLDLVERGTLTAPYPTNIPWPTLVPGDDGEPALLVTFDGTRHGGRVVGYGSHGDVVIARRR